MEDDRLDTCSTCDEESCYCPEVCDKCKGWSATCKCVTEPILAYSCKDCGETGEADLEATKVDGNNVVYPLCGSCGSVNVIRVDEVIDAAEYAKGDR